MSAADVAAFIGIAAVLSYCAIWVFSMALLLLSSLRNRITKGRWDV